MATRPLPPKTEAMLALAKGYLIEMELASEGTDRFRRAVANFLTAARSVEDVLVNELAGGHPQVKDDIKPLIARAMKRDAEMGSLIDARNDHIHEGSLVLDVRFIPERGGISGDPGLDDFFRRQRLRRQGFQPLHRARAFGVRQPPVQVPRAFFGADALRDVYEVCVEHLEKVSKAAAECTHLYP